MRYFLDTNCLLGLTFAHDVWNPDSNRLFDTDNTLYTGKAVLYEYCNRTKDARGDSASAVWTAENGVYGRIRADIRMAKLLTDQRLQTYRDEELTAAIVADEFIEQFEIQEEAQARVRRYFEAELEEPVTRRDARDAVRTIADYILEQSRKSKEKLEARLHLDPSRDTTYPRRREQISRYIHDSDAEVLCDALYLREEKILERVITADKGIYENRENLNSVLGLRILFLKDAFANEISDGEPISDSSAL